MMGELFIWAICVVVFLLFLTIITKIITWINFFKVRHLIAENKKIKDQLSQILSTKKEPIFASEEIAKKPKINFEQPFDVHLSIWLGGVALALAGVFTVKYSIDAGFLTPKIRVILSGIFAFVLLHFGKKIRLKENFANGKKISQTLVGSSIVVLYATIFAATNLYHFLPSFLGFLAMACVTILAIFMSLKYGQAIAIFALAGGFLTPALISLQNPTAVKNFVYLYLLLAGIFYLIRQQNWWKLFLPTLLASFSWSAFWLSNNFSSLDSFWLGFFLVANCITALIASKDAIENGAIDKIYQGLSIILIYSALGGSTLLMTLLVRNGNFELIEWSPFVLLAIASVVLAYFKQKIYGIVPIITCAACALMLLVWNNFNINALIFILGVFVLTYVVSGYRLMWQAANPKLWGLLVGGASFGYFAIAYYKLNFLLPIKYPVWGLLALLFSLLAAQVTTKISEQFLSDEKTKQNLLAIFATTSGAFLLIGLLIELNKEFLTLAFATQILAISFIDKKIAITALRKIILVLLVIFALLLMPQIFALIELSLSSIFGDTIQSKSSLTNWQLVSFFGSALIFLGSNFLLLKQKSGKINHFLETAAVVLMAIFGYYSARNILNDFSWSFAVKSGFIERGIITNIFCQLGFVGLFFGKKFNRQALKKASFALLLLAAARVIFFDFLIYNPLLSHQRVGSLPIFNALILPYGLPALTLFFANKNLSFLTNKWHFLCSKIFALVSLFVLVSLNVRQIFHGEYLENGIIKNGENYTYSVVWLLLGILLLFVGTYAKNKTTKNCFVIADYFNRCQSFSLRRFSTNQTLPSVLFIGFGR